jgi:hypothetical protein
MGQLIFVLTYLIITLAGKANIKIYILKDLFNIKYRSGKD